MEAKELMYKMSIIVKEEICKNIHSYFTEIYKTGIPYSPTETEIATLYDMGLKAAGSRMKRDIKPEEVEAVKEKSNG
jgi:hypothetical protein